MCNRTISVDNSAELLNIIRNSSKDIPSNRYLRKEYIDFKNQVILVTLTIKKLQEELLNPNLLPEEKQILQQQISEQQQVLDMISQNEKDLGNRLGQINKKSQNKSINPSQCLEISSNLITNIKNANLDSNLTEYIIDTFIEVKEFLCFYPKKLTTLKKFSYNQFNTLIDCQANMNNYIKNAVTIKKQINTVQRADLDETICAELDSLIQKLNLLLKPIDEIIIRESKNKHHQICKISGPSKDKKHKKKLIPTSKKPTEKKKPKKPRREDSTYDNSKNGFLELTEI